MNASTGAGELPAVGPRIPPCCTLSAGAGWLALDPPLAALDDVEGDRVPEGLPPVVDAHIHVFPDRLAEAIRRWFDAYGWPIRYRLPAIDTARYLLARGVARVFALPYAHAPGVARGLNAFVADLARAEPHVVPFATVMPGEPGAASILEEAFAAGLRGVKLHCHVQCFAPDAPELDEVYDVCARAGRAVIVHAGREPSSPRYRCDPHTLCSADRVERVLRDHPRLRLCVPHLGADEFDAYERLIERYDGLWLDTTMVLADYFPVDPPLALVRRRPGRVLYGTDFPNVPYAWDRELVRIAKLGLPDDELEQLLSGAALSLLGEAP